MNSIINNFRRMFRDDGRDDKDYSEQEKRLAVSVGKLLKAADLMKSVADDLSDLIKSRTIN